MRHINLKQIIGIAGLGIIVSFAGCEDLEYALPAPNTTPGTLTANVLFVNASPTAPSLDLFINGLKAGESLASGNAQAAYTTVPITSTIFSGGSTTAGANTSIRAKATTGTIGGVLGSSDLIFRAGSTNTNNFVAGNTSRYTLFALDSITRPKPVRLLNALDFADTTFFNPLAGAYISRVEKAALTAAERTKVVAIGTVPLGSSDPGGIRFLLLTETFLTFPGGNTTQSQVRFLNLSPNGGSLFVRLKPAAGSNIPVTPPATPYILSFPGFPPSVGSRATTSAFTLQTTATDLVTPINYNIEVSTDNGFTTGVVYTSPTVTFSAGKIYTVYIKGLKGAISAGVVTHN